METTTTTTTKGARITILRLQLDFTWLSDWFHPYTLSEMVDKVVLSGPRPKSLNTITPSGKKMLSSNFNFGEET